ncbi:DUF2244 domain-containing protein [Pelagibius sp. Alg239-R121]|uniref:DUF2244 domain-containing protein n=1 Tax=Pelagibius sp. Alg239-R121 TaxID=2993448 RepID=UPI0024A6295F|nr:DUF2244 domain-containing protein [Pelagibius sp. Alg239-R121]
MTSVETQPDTGGEDEPPLLLNARLRPNRSLSPRGFVILMTIVCTVSFVGGLAFFLSGAWPVVGFLGFDVLLIFLAFRINYRDGRNYETLCMTRRELEVTKVNYHGKVRRWLFQPAWLQVDIDNPVEHNSMLTLRSHGRSLIIGSFLTPEERAEVANAISNALMRARRAEI